MYDSPCEAGFDCSTTTGLDYQPKHVDTALSCPAGYYCAGGTSAKVACPAGKYTNSTESTACLFCPAGRYSSKSAVDTPYCPGVCSAGTYNSKIGQKENTCELCPSGRFSGVAGLKRMADCSNCSAGRYSSVPGLTKNSECELCPSGRFSGVALSLIHI